MLLYLAEQQAKSNIIKELTGLFNNLQLSELGKCSMHLPGFGKCQHINVRRCKYGSCARRHSHQQGVSSYIHCIWVSSMFIFGYNIVYSAVLYWHDLEERTEMIGLVYQLLDLPQNPNPLGTFTAYARRECGPKTSTDLVRNSSYRLMHLYPTIAPL